LVKKDDPLGIGVVVKSRNIAAISVLALVLGACGTGNDEAGNSPSSNQTPSTSQATTAAPTDDPSSSPGIAAQTEVAFQARANPIAGNADCSSPCWLPTQTNIKVIPGESVTPRDKWPLQGDTLDVLCKIVSNEPLSDTQGNRSYVWYKILAPAKWVTDPFMRAKVERVPSLKGYAVYVSEAFVSVPADASAPLCAASH
jgi:hypothetical protein